MSDLFMLNGVYYADLPREVRDALFYATERLAAAHDLIAHARLISPSERAVIYVADLERALGLDAPVPHKLGGNDA